MALSKTKKTYGVFAPFSSVLVYSPNLLINITASPCIIHTNELSVINSTFGQDLVPLNDQSPESYCNP